MHAYIWTNPDLTVIAESVCDALEYAAERGIQLDDDYFVIPEYMYDYYTAEVH